MSTFLSYRTLQIAVLSCGGAALCIGGLSLIAARRSRGAASAHPPVPSSTAAQQQASLDEFHPDHQPGPDGIRPPLPKPARGGKVIVHLELLPPNLCFPLNGKAVSHWILYEVNETLGRLDWQTVEWKPLLATSWDVDDSLVLKPERAGKYAGLALEIRGAQGPEQVLCGRAEFQEARGAEGAAWRLAPGADTSRFQSALDVPAEDVLALRRASVCTLHLREGVRWQDGHPFDSGDVLWSYGIYTMPGVKCDALRYQFEKIGRADALDALTARFVFNVQYFSALDTLLDMCLLPRHLYDLCDPDNRAADPEIHARLAGEHDEAGQTDEAARARYVNENPRNRMWVGLGPYRVTSWGDNYVEATRWDGYFDPSDAGWFDTIRWRYVTDTAAPQAVLSGELDFWYRMKSDDYFGDYARSEAFTRTHYKGHFYTNTLGCLIWNTQRPKFRDPAVRQALARAFDFDEFKRDFYKGLAKQLTGAQSHLGPVYDGALQPFACDPAKSAEQLALAGWYDRDGDGLIDRDGEPFRFEFLYPAGNAAGQAFGVQYQQSLKKLGIALDLRALDGATVSERAQKRDFDSVNLAWVPPLENDPEQLFHSRWSKPGVEGSNYCGLADPTADALIERGQRELDDQARYSIWRELQARLYELQPYLFMFSPPRKFAMNLKIRGFQAARVEPCFVIRHWYYPE